MAGVHTNSRSSKGLVDPTLIGILATVALFLSLIGYVDRRASLISVVFLIGFIAVFISLQSGES